MDAAIVFYLKLAKTRLASFDWNKVVKLDPCVYCHRRADHRKKGRDMTVEHVIPISKGGTNTPDNKVGACDQCNVKRGNTPLILHLMRLRKRLKD